MSNTYVSPTSPCGIPGTVNRGTKFMSDIMSIADSTSDASSYAKQIMNIDRTPAAFALNPSNRRQNVYGLIVMGVAVNVPGLTAGEPSSRKAVADLLATLNGPVASAGAPPSYTPAVLTRRATQLRQAAECIKGTARGMLEDAEITPGDHQNIVAIADGAATFAKKLDELAAVWTQKFGADVLVYMNIAPASH